MKIELVASLAPVVISAIASALTFRQRRYLSARASAGEVVAYVTTDKIRGDGGIQLRIENGSSSAVSDIAVKIDGDKIAEFPKLEPGQIEWRNLAIQHTDPSLLNRKSVVTFTDHSTMEWELTAKGPISVPRTAHASERVFAFLSTSASLFALISVAMASAILSYLVLA
ncbi:hypothetical protein [Streptomyces sp. NPDC127072]|uniref:hypothetical protein n=1 Tax=Streptomyces sp. NPDC127072 TaxID=3347129 RepID=UPI0036487B17